jgi:membrane protease YdiL (CAAX protease family)
LETAPPPPNRSGENPVWTGWDVAGIAFLIFVAPLLLAPFVVLAAQKLFYPHASFQQVALHPGITLGLQIGWFAIVALFLYAFVRGRYQQSPWAVINWNWPKGRWGVLIAVAAATLIASKVLERFVPFPKVSPFDQFLKSPLDGYAFALLAMAFAPFMEELFFRGFLYPVLARRFGIAAGIPLTAFPFALIHYFEYKSWGPVLIIFMVGIVLTWVRAVTRSVGASFVVHAIYNGVPVIATIIISHGFHRLDKLAT